MDNYTMDELILAFALKFENNAPVILQRLFEGTPVSVEEIDEILKKVEEKYVVITSDDYPVILGGLDDPPVCLFYDGDLDVFQKDIHVYESVDNKADKIFIGIVNKGDEAEWCVATTDQEVLQPVVEEVFERNDNLEFKKYKQPQSAVLN